MATPAVTSEVRCYHCGSANYFKSGFEKSKQRLRCNDCGKGFYDVLPARKQHEKVISGFRCYHCGSDQTCKAGYSKFGGKKKQRFHCRNCNRKFRENLERATPGTGEPNFWQRKNLPSAGHLILDLQAIAQSLLGRTPTAADIRELSKQGRSNPLNVFRAVFGSYSEAVRRARLKPDHIREYNPEVMLAELRALHKKLGRPLLKRDIADASKKGKVPTLHFLRREFGSVGKAVIAAGAGRKIYSRGEMIDCLRKIDASMKWPVQKRDIDEAFRKGEGPSNKAVLREFGTLGKAYRTAGLKKGSSYMRFGGKITHRDRITPKKYTIEELIEQLRDLKKKLGKRPTFGDIKQASKERFCCNPSTFSVRFGGLRAAYRAAGIDDSRKGG